nr:MULTISPECIES: photosystem II reaction center protein J [unclassified Dolichospermum]
MTIFVSEEKTVSGSGRIPLWVVATIAGLGVITVVGIFFYGSYSGIGSSM